MAIEDMPHELKQQTIEEPRKGRSPMGDAVRQLMRNRIAVAGGIFLILIIFVALLSDDFIFSAFTGKETEPLLAPYHFAEVNFKAHDLGPLTTAEDGRFYLLGVDYAQPNDVCGSNLTFRSDCRSYCKSCHWRYLRINIGVFKLPCR